MTDEQQEAMEQGYQRALYDLSRARSDDERVQFYAEFRSEVRQRSTSG